jgi:hypothetical protein
MTGTASNLEPRRMTGSDVSCRLSTVYARRAVLAWLPRSD